MTQIKASALTDNLQTQVSNFKNTLSSIGSRLSNLVSNKIPQAIGSQVSSIPFKIAQNNLDQQSKGIYNIPESAFPPIKPMVPQSRQQPQQFMTPAPRMTQIPEEFINVVPKTYPELEAAKQKVLNNNNFRPEAKQYLNKIPVTYRAPSMLDQQYAGISEAKGTPFREIGVNPNLKMDAKQLETVIQHEMLHQTPRLVPPELFHPQNKSVVNEYAQRWGQQYAKNPKALVEEMFAQQDLPPAYYWHVFKQVNPKATKESFVTYLKSFFMNNVNNPQTANSVIPSRAGIPNVTVRDNGWRPSTPVQLQQVAQPPQPVQYGQLNQ